MGTTLALIATLLLSIVVALMAALPLAIFFRATEEFIVVFAAIPVFAVITMLAFTVAYASASDAQVFHRVAIVFAAIATGIVATPIVLGLGGSGPTGPSAKDIQITLELLVPALIAILIQWGLVRHRWLRMHGQDALSRWPWITSVVGALAILNPPVLDLIGWSVRQSPTDLFRGLAAATTIIGLAALIAAALIECTIRTRMLHRRLAGHSAAGPGPNP